VPTPTDKPIQAAAGTQFAIELESNPTTGYEWQPVFSPEKVRLVRRAHSPAGRQADGEGPAFGAGRAERFVFEALAAGTTTIRMALKRSWEPAAIVERSYRVIVRG
jgi:predicted secreted protein